MDDNKKFLDGNRDINIEKMLIEYRNFKEDRERLIKTCEDMKLEYDYIINQHKESINSKLESLTSFIGSQLKDEEMKQTKTMSSYELPSGKFIIKKSAQKIVLNKNLNMDEIPPKYIKEKTVKSVDWANYKKTFEIVDGEAVNKETGEIEKSDNVYIEYVPYSMGIKLNDKE